LAIFPDKEEEFLFDQELPFYMSPASVRDRHEKYRIVDNEAMQVDSVVYDQEKQGGGVVYLNSHSKPTFVIHTAQDHCMQRARSGKKKDPLGV
jgi:hypothetical protein